MPIEAGTTEQVDLKQLEQALEAILFTAGEPVAAQRLAQALEIDEFTLKKVTLALEDRLSRESGLALWNVEDRYQLVTKPETAETVRKSMEIRRDIPLSPAAFEVLAIIAYRQPVTKAYVEQTRGVDCSGIISNLVIKGLIEEKGRLELPGRPLLYGTTDNFLRCFGIETLEQLPDLTEIELEAGQNAADSAEDSDQEPLPIGADT
ncbi:MAG TPA: SMC-Scp complex subunit ScpB [Oscillospiraceae bacterium]|nr:SMC-Scp complex subunit ScpB [Oscillospiraceae bacterium]HPF56935.1 SMC-Scp complex subunit ScpB [Clostridiales bacterium]HPK35657.1 SMC-Scp complex subunit ScpB [Oscillospiraceae bacterium]HPR75805.1 SMC-Scp complex subunit ScpB [Oscillospiraceae bacterium]